MRHIQKKRYVFSSSMFISTVLILIVAISISNGHEGIQMLFPPFLHSSDECIFQSGGFCTGMNFVISVSHPSG